MTQKTNNNNETANAHFGILLNPKNVLDIEDLKKENHPDQFGFEKKIPEFVNYVNEYLGKRKSLVVGVYGDYGSGKSVFVNMVKTKLGINNLYDLLKHKLNLFFLEIKIKFEKNNGRRNTLFYLLKKEQRKGKFIVFHSWKYQDEQTIWRNFVLKVAKELFCFDYNLFTVLRNRIRLFELKRDFYYTHTLKSVPLFHILPLTILIIFFYILNYFGIFQNSSNGAVLYSIILGTLSWVVMNLSLFVTERTRSSLSSIEEFENIFRKTINNCKCDKIYIVIENIDRCLPHHSIRLLDSLKAFLEEYDERTNKDLIFLIPCDKNILQLAIEKEYGNSNKLNASTYLDKLIQLPYDLPVCSDKDWKGYVESLLNTQHINIPLSFENGKTNKTENKTFSEWIIEMLGFAQITNPREVKILFREWEMRFINLPGELKNNKGKGIRSALFLLKLLVLKKKGYTHDLQKSTRNNVEIGSSNIYNGIELFCLHIKPNIEEKYKKSKRIYGVFKQEIPNIESLMQGVNSIGGFENRLKDYKNKSYSNELRDYIEPFLTKKKKFRVEENDFFKYILNANFPKYNKGAALDFRHYNSDFLPNNDAVSIKQIQNFITHEIFTSSGALAYVVGDLLIQNYDVPKFPKNTDKRIQLLLLNSIRPSSFEDLKKFMLTTKSAKESSKSQYIPKGSVPT